jgi:hypothetical protein
MQDEPQHKVPAVSNDLLGGKSAMSQINPQTPDQDVAGAEKPTPIDTDDSKPKNFMGEFNVSSIGKKPAFGGITHRGD